MPRPRGKRGGPDRQRAGPSGLPAMTPCNDHQQDCRPARLAGQRAARTAARTAAEGWWQDRRRD